MEHNPEPAGYFNQPIEPVEDEPLTDRERIFQIMLELQEGEWEGVLKDGQARIIASQYYYGPSSVLYSFVSTGAIDVKAMTPEVRLDFDIAVNENEQVDALVLNALMKYFRVTGDRGPVAGWHEETKW